MGLEHCDDGLQPMVAPAQARVPSVLQSGCRPRIRVADLQVGAKAPQATAQRAESLCQSHPVVSALNAERVGRLITDI